MQPLIADYTTVYAEPEQFYDNYNRDYIDKFNTTQPCNNMHYMPWPVFNNVETPPQPPKSRPTTTASTDITTRCSSDNPPVDYGINTIGLRTLFNTQQQVTSPSKSFSPQHISTSYPRVPLSYPQTPHSPQPLAYDISPFNFQCISQVITTQPTTPLVNKSVNEKLYPTEPRMSGRQAGATKLFKDPLPWDALKDKKK